MSRVIAVDVGGTSIKGALVDHAGTLQDRLTVATPVSLGPDAIVSAIAQVIRDLLAPDVTAAGVVVPGIVDEVDGMARYSANLGWRDVPLRRLLTESLGVRVVLGKDVVAAGLAERAVGAAREVSDCLLVVIGTGIASVPIVEGRPVRGAAGSVGEIGHAPVFPDGEPCACGQRGCVEVYASAAGIARRYRVRSGVARTAAEIAGTLDADPLAREVWCEASEALGLALASYTLVMDPALIILAGGLALAGPALRDPVHASLARRLTWRPAPGVELSPLGGDAGLHGAALLARPTGAAEVDAKRSG